MGHICKLGIMSPFLPEGCFFEGCGATMDFGVWTLLINITELAPCSFILGAVDPACSQHLGFQKAVFCPEKEAGRFVLLLTAYH